MKIIIVRSVCFHCPVCERECVKWPVVRSLEGASAERAVPQQHGQQPTNAATITDLKSLASIGE